MRLHSKVIAFIMLLTFIVSGIEGHCFKVTQAVDKTAESVLSFEEDNLEHNIEATINESASVVALGLSWTEKYRVKLSTPDLLSFIISTSSHFSITSYTVAVITIYFSNRLFLVFSHFTI